MSKLNNVSVSIIIPAYNEEHLIQQVLEEMVKDAKGFFKNNFEIIVVNDGSTDKTGTIIRKLVRLYPSMHLITHFQNQGLGGAILSGIKVSHYEFVTFLPADGQVYLRDIVDALGIAPQYDMVLTYRGNTYDYTLSRKIISRIHKIFMRVLFNLSYKDYNWVQIYNREKFINMHIYSKGVFFLSEVTLRAHHYGYKICEIKSRYRPRISGKSKVIRLSVVFNTVIELLKIRILMSFGNDKKF